MSHADDFDQTEDADGRAPLLASSFVAIFIRRPILASVLSLLIVIAGLAALLGVEVRELPDIDQPIVTVRTSYPGAAPESMDEEVTAIIENAVSQVDGVKTISSESSFARSDVVVEFSPNVDINIAASDVKNAVSAIQGRLPEAAEEPTVVKADSNGSPIMRLTVFAPGMTEGELGDMIDKVIIPRLQSVEGIASVEDYGVRNRVIRVRLNPVQLAARGISVDDVAQLVAASSTTMPSGTLRAGRQELLIRADASAIAPEQVGALRLNDDTTVSDVAVVEWGVEQEKTVARFNKAQAAGLGILRQAQSNTVSIADGVREAIADLKTILPPDVEILAPVDESIFIKRAIEEVILTLCLSIAIVIGVIFIFLRSLRTTLIPTLAIPISLVGTVAAIWLAGFSINILTLLALVMATGLVVDDAIVVTENIQRWRAMGYGRRAAALLGTREILFAVMATTATLAAVFIPISFMPGQAGRLFSEFGFVLAFSILISSIVALTLCPMLNVKLGSDRDARAHDKPEKHKGPIDAFAGSAARFYANTLAFVLRAPLIAFGVSIAFAAGAVLVFTLIPKELTPLEDRGRMVMVVTVQQSANIDYLKEKVSEVEDKLQPLVDSGEAVGIISILGFGNSTRAFVMAQLKDWSERDRSQQEIEAQYRPLVTSIPGINVQFRRSNSLGIRGAGQGLQFAIAADDYGAAADVAEQFAGKLQENPLFARADLNFETSQPQLNVRINRDAATRLGVNVRGVSTLISTMADEYKAAEIFVNDRIVEVFLTASGEPIDDPSDLANLFVKTRDGRFVPLSLIASIDETAVAARLAREERRRAVPVTATLAEGATLGEAIQVLREITPEVLPANMSVLLVGEAKLLQASSESAYIVFAFAGLIVLLVLAAQFESFVSAVVLMVTVPFGLAAAIYAMLLTGGSFNYYSQIGFVLLIGIMAKNGILIVEFANALRDKGIGIREAVQEAASVRLRPVLMTALSTVLGGLPLILGHGAGAESRAALGWIVIGGLGFSTLFTLYLTPASYLLLARFATTRAKEGMLVDQELADAARLEKPGLKPAE